MVALTVGLGALVWSAESLARHARLSALRWSVLGLAVAVPAVLGYNWLIRRNKTAMDRVKEFGADLHAVLLSAPKSPAPART